MSHNKSPVGYLVKHRDGLRGERGQYYDYVIASNGVFIEAEGNLLAARIPVRLCEIRGLAPLEPKVVLRHGLIPQRFFDLAMSSFLANRHKERYVAVVWSGEYNIVVPPQAESPEALWKGDQGIGCESGVTYVNPTNVILDLHSHGKMMAEFSLQDDKDETGFKLYSVCGHLNQEPEIRLRVGIYGYFYSIPWSKVFDGELRGIKEIEGEDSWLQEYALADVGYLSRRDMAANGDVGIIQK